jgi:hypothetical protein
LLAAACASLVLAACSYEVAYRADYLPPAKPPFVAQGRLLIVMPEEQRKFVYEGRPTSRTGDFTTLTIPVGAIVEDIAKEVFSGCFAYGVDVVDTLANADDFVLALAGDMEGFVYSYTKIIEQGFGEAESDSWIVPEVDIAFHVKAYDRGGATVLEKMYHSGLRAGESYRVTGHPEERINRALHETLHGLMLDLAGDVYPLLQGKCEVTDVANAR